MNNLFKVEEVKNFVEVGNELIDKVKNVISETYEGFCEKNHVEIGDCAFEFEGVNYDFIEVEKSNWEDADKYQYRDIVYQLLSLDGSKNIVDKTNLLLVVQMSRIGSYYTDYCYVYNIQDLLLVNVDIIPEKIILEHEEIKVVEIKMD